MRAAAEMQKQQSQGGGRGMMGIVLPMYAIGICVYLVYTLFKVRPTFLVHFVLLFIYLIMLSASL